VAAAWLREGFLYPSPSLVGQYFINRLCGFNKSSQNSVVLCNTVGFCDTIGYLSITYPFARGTLAVRHPISCCFTVTAYTVELGGKQFQGFPAYLNFPFWGVYLFTRITYLWGSSEILLKVSLDSL